MKKPQIIDMTHSENQVDIRLKISADLDYFQGHFVEQPILPGVAQLDFVIDFAQKIWSIDKKNIKAILQLKFIRVILPDDRLTLVLKRHEEMLSFHYSDNVGRMVSMGKIRVR
ncbi:MAG: hypothetical protein ACO2ZM_08195 [Francisellaceae bacterium]